MRHTKNPKMAEKKIRYTAKENFSSVNKQQLFLNLMFSWSRLNTFDDLLIAFYQPIIFSHYFLLSLSQRGQRYTINRSVLLMVSSACATVRLITLSAGVLERAVLRGGSTSHPSHQSHNPGSRTLGASTASRPAAVTCSSASARVRVWPQR